jgi:TorA maturation chaperone TorD
MIMITTSERPDAVLSPLLTMPASDRLSLLVGEQLLFGLLARLLFDFPERNWLESLAEDAIFAEIPFAAQQPNVKAGSQLLHEWDCQFHTGLANDMYEAIALDYTRLFLGPDHVLAPPWESVHRNPLHLTFQQETLGVRAWYRRFGLVLQRKENEPDDHLGLELAFLAHLAGKAIEAYKVVDDDGLIQVLRAQGDFLTAHPLRWVKSWCSQVLDQAGTDFYRGVALLAHGSLQEAAQLLDVKLPQRRS